ncbi:MAG: SMC family ATPase [Clostridia bacterium]|nr:SMC family ATPase [Clostridia bacterium]
MKPVYLRMQAFGPYAGVQEIDFRKLDGAGLYLVCGDTGAGKSTIFDAIAYALYDEKAAPGSEHRSKYASPETETEVELHFLHQGKEWSILRKPSQEVLKRRGTGTRQVAASVLLTLPDGRQITRIEEARDAVTEALGLNAEQFKQVIMIAQGDFDRVLHASTADRQDILRQILNTDFYRQLQNRIKDDVREIKARRDSVLQQIQVHESAIRMEGCEELAQTEPLLKTHSLTPEEVLQALRTVIARDKAALAELEQRRDIQHEALAAADSLLTFARQRVDTLQQKQVAEDAKDRLSAALEQAGVQLTQAKAEAPKALKYREEAAKIDSLLPRFDQLEALRTRIAQSERLRDQLSRSVREKKAAADDLQARIGAAEAEISQREGDLDLQLEAQQELERLRQRGDALRKAVEDADDMIKLRQQSAESSALYLQAQQEYLHALTTEKEMRDAHLRGKAALIAQDLVEGKACPVCGSTCHPAPAVLTGEEPSEAQLESAGRAAEQKRQRQETAFRKASEDKTRCDALAERLHAALAELLPGQDADALHAELAHTRALWQEVNGEIHRLQASCSRRQQLVDELPALRTQHQEAVETHTADQARMIEAGAALDAAQRQEAEILRTLPFPSRNEALAQQQSLRARADDIDKTIAAGTQRQQELEKQLAAKAAEIAALDKQLGELPDTTVDEAQEKRSAARQAWQETDEAVKALHARCNANTDVQAKLTDAYRTLEGIDARYRWMEALNATANGQISTKKITLEAFVQQHFFDRILQRANLRLRRMSDEQYTFARSEEQHGNTNTSLALDVVDSWNGTRRSVKTLSGGESFLASLALALGFSDEIQATAGGVQLDTLFIDEGFGTLDEAALNGAISVLQSLSDSHRQVGIISHVEELRRRIDRKIVVRKDVGMMGSVAVIE